MYGSDGVGCVSRRAAAHPPTPRQILPAARLACDEARTARIGGGDGQWVLAVACSYPSWKAFSNIKNTPSAGDFEI